MWIFTETGFVSAVQSSKDSETMSVRARDKQSLVSIAEVTGQPILRSPEGDYPYRVFVSKVEFAQWAFEQAMNIDYRNFKNRVFDTRGYEYAHELGRVWSVMLATEDADSRSGSTGDLVDPAQTMSDSAQKMSDPADTVEA
jgi:hypothetical protein